MYRDPDITGGVGDLVVNVTIDYKVVSFQVSILDIVYSGSVN